MLISAKIPRIASIVAFVLAAGVVFVAVTGPIIFALAALIPLFAGIGIMRRRVWSAYGFGLYLLAQLLPFLLTLFRAGSLAAAPQGLIASAVWAVLLGSFFLLAG